jgi:ribosomal protein L11 methyltransferase
VAASVCAENVSRNDVGGVIRVRAGTLDDSPPAELFDLVLANITIATLLQLKAALAVQLRPGGLAVLSGVLAERADELLDALRAEGWVHVRTNQEQDWVALLVRRP